MSIKLFHLSNGCFMWKEGKVEVPCMDTNFIYEAGLNFFSIPPEETEIAIEEMLKKEHNVAEFGEWNRAFVFTDRIDNWLTWLILLL